MALDILVTTDRINRDPAGRSFVDYLNGNARQLSLEDAILYYDFPTYSDYDTVTHKPDALLVSSRHGILAIRFFDSKDLVNDEGRNRCLEIDASLSQFCSILIGRLLKSRLLRSNRATLSFQVLPVVFLSALPAGIELPGLESDAVSSFDGFGQLLSELKAKSAASEVLAEIRAVVEGAKALNRPQPRRVEDPSKQKKAAALSQLEADIANFDERQRRVALVTIIGPQRIRGLAGSGKTVILAMKAAHLHLTQPDQMILFTFYTKSLRALIKTLITRFFRHYKDQDPDWGKVHIRHGWGGSSIPGTYADACKRQGLSPLSFSAAKAAASILVEPFDHACRDLLSKKIVQPHYDHVLIDEGQDFPGAFYELCYELAKGERDKKNIVWAYDELQNILNIKIRSAEQLFGTDEDGEPRVSLERSSQGLPPGSTNDTVLSKCYRNQREVLVTAHALGFGIYRNIVQLLESKEHWEDVGYEVAKGDFSIGTPVSILRPEGNSPLALDSKTAGSLIEYFVADSLTTELTWIVDGILGFIAEGLQPEDISVVALDDRNARSYFGNLSSELAARGIATNNIIADPYNEPPYTLSGKVTLSTVYRAKGNESAVIFALGVDAIPLKSRFGRNRLFTAFTRSKAWLRVSGVGPSAAAVCDEIKSSMNSFPYLNFVMPDLKEVNLIQRDLGKRAAKVKKIRDDYVRKLREEGVSEEDVAEILAIEVKHA